MKETIKLVSVLTIICAFSAAMLAAVYNKTIAPINAALEIKTANAAGEVIPAGFPQVVKQEIKGEMFFVSRDADGTVKAVAVQGSSKNGYGGDMTLMVGLSSDRTLVSFRVISSKETAGLGTKIVEPEFMNPLLGKPFSSNWKVRKDGGDFDAVTSATISSRAALDCIRDAILKYEKSISSLSTGN
jgi:electron transport complex protein RnfG